MKPAISRVVLYKHGVASFERQIDIENNQTILLNFKQNEMNDVLKSLTVLDLSGSGRIASISYDNNKSTEQRIAESVFSVQGISFIEILSQLTGAEVSLEHNGTTITGVICATSQFNSTTAGYVQFVSLWHENSLRLINLQEVSNLKVTDPTIQKQLTDALSVQRETKIKDQRTISIATEGEGQRRIAMSYFIEAPSWKVSYRIIIPEVTKEKNEDEDGKLDCVLQGWAIVDNITEEPWEKVQLTLISGKPHSHEVDLVNPDYKRKKQVPVEPDFDYQQPYQSQVMNKMPQQMMAMNVMPQQMMARNAPLNTLASASRQPETTTSTKDLGDMAQYDLLHPVSIQSNQSAMVPIVDTKFSGSRVVLYNSENHSSHPNSAVLLTNTTGLTLEGGPCSVFDSGTFVGESLFETIQREEVKFIEYATEVSIDVWTRSDTKEKLHKSSISNGRLILQKQMQYIQTYHFRNKSAKQVPAYIEHRFRKGFDLIDTPAPTNPKPINFYIFKTKLPANETTLFPVTEQLIQSHTISVENMTRESYQDLLSRSMLDSDTSDAIRAYLNLKERVIQIDEQIHQVQSEINKIYENHSRIRSNLSSLPSTEASSESLRSRYIKEMEADEARLAEKQQNLNSLIVEKTAARDEAESILAKA